MDSTETTIATDVASTTAATDIAAGRAKVALAGRSAGSGAEGQESIAVKVGAGAADACSGGAT